MMEKKSLLVPLTIPLFFSPLTTFHVYFWPIFLQHTMFSVRAALPSHCYSVVEQRQLWKFVGVFEEDLASDIWVSCWKASHSQAMFFGKSNLEDKINELTWLLLEGSCKFLTLKSFAAQVSHALVSYSNGVHQPRRSCQPIYCSQLYNPMMKMKE